MGTSELGKVGVVRIQTSDRSILRFESFNGAGYGGLRFNHHLQSSVHQASLWPLVNFYKV
jgi:hypothetical protein